MRRTRAGLGGGVGRVGAGVPTSFFLSFLLNVVCSVVFCLVVLSRLGVVMLLCPLRSCVPLDVRPIRRAHLARCSDVRISKRFAVEEVCLQSWLAGGKTSKEWVARGNEACEADR